MTPPVRAMESSRALTGSIVFSDCSTLADGAGDGADSGWIAGAGPGETETFLNDTGATSRGGTVSAVTGRRCGFTINPSTRRIPVTLTTIVPAARRPRRNRERGRPLCESATSRFFSGATSAR